MLLMSLKAAFEADYALLGNSLSCLDKSCDKLVRLWNAASKLISHNRCRVPTLYRKSQSGQKDETTYFTRQKSCQPNQTFCVVQKEIRKEVMIYGTKSAIHPKQRGHSSS